MAPTDECKANGCVQQRKQLSKRFADWILFLDLEEQSYFSLDLNVIQSAQSAY